MKCEQIALPNMKQLRTDLQKNFAQPAALSIDTLLWLPFLWVPKGSEKERPDSESNPPGARWRQTKSF